MIVGIRCEKCRREVSFITGNPSSMMYDLLDWETWNHRENCAGARIVRFEQDENGRDVFTSPPGK